MADDRQQTYDDFKDAVNMTASELDDWLDTDESKSVGQDGGGGESKGHRSGREIVKILRKNKSDLTDANYDRMEKVVGYVRRHLAQKPSGDIEGSAWWASLKNWGHDPCKHMDC
jgi:hypothetical protein